jgi:hypothetical protein
VSNEINPLWALTAFFVLLYAIFFLLGSVDSIFGRIQRRRHAAKLEHVILPRATIAHDLAPKLRKFLQARPTIYVTAGDGHPLTTAKIYPWFRFIRDALECGGKIYYIVADAEQRDRVSLSKAASKLTTKRSGFHLHFLNPKSVNAEERQIADTFRTFHVLLIEAGPDRAMWIEAYHPANSTVAYGCEFVPPELAATDPRYERYAAMLKAIVADCERRQNDALAA